MWLLVEKPFWPFPITEHIQVTLHIRIFILEIHPHSFTMRILVLEIHTLSLIQSYTIYLLLFDIPFVEIRVWHQEVTLLTKCKDC